MTAAAEITYAWYINSFASETSEDLCCDNNRNVHANRMLFYF